MTDLHVTKINCLTYRLSNGQNYCNYRRLLLFGLPLQDYYSIWSP